MGVAKHQLARLDDALECLRRAVELAPTNAIAWSNLGFTLSALSRNDEALACYQRAIELNPQNLGAWDNMIALMERLGRSADALSARRSREKASHLHPLLTEGVELIH
jgi:tetratricopeptide (TPR) repeat protein